MKRLLMLMGIASAVSCARPAAPPGGDQDRSAPRVIATTPASDSIVPGFSGSVVFHFDEKLSERGIREDGAVVSPETGRATLERDGSEIKVRIDGGWRANTIYRVVLPPGLADRFGNARREPAELVFSTGPALIPAAIGGVVRDRITGRPVSDFRVVAIGVADSTVLATVTDSAGFFGIRFVGLGRYNLQAYEDQNRNRKPDGRERSAATSVNVGTVRDTIAVELVVLAPDTTAARLLRAEARDSLQVRLVFDDHLDPAQPSAQIAVQLFRMPDSTAVPGARVVTAREFDRLQARADSARRTRGDTTAAPPIRPPQPSGQQASRDTTTLPTQELFLVPATPLEPRVRYRVEVRNVRNLLLLPNGGGSVSFMTPARPTPPPAPPRRDTINVPAGNRR